MNSQITVPEASSGDFRQPFTAQTLKQQPNKRLSTGKNSAVSQGSEEHISAPKLGTKPRVVSSGTDFRYSDAASAKIETIFKLEAPNAKAVLLVGEFGDWDRAPVKMIKGNRGVWRAIVPLAPGRHQYRFIVDGEWQNDPAGAEKVPNPFGTFNNVVGNHLKRSLNCSTGA